MAQKLLIVDDDELLLDVVKKDASTQNWIIFSAVDGQQALNHLRQNNIDVILSDIKMPTIDGLSMLETIRQERNFIPVIFMTGYTDKAKLLKALRYKAVDVIEKPYDRAQLLRSLSVAMEVSTNLAAFSNTVKTLASNRELSPEKAHTLIESQQALLSSLFLPDLKKTA